MLVKLVLFFIVAIISVQSVPQKIIVTGPRSPSKNTLPPRSEKPPVIPKAKRGEIGGPEIKNSSQASGEEFSGTQTALKKDISNSN